MALLVLTGSRAASLISLKLKHVHRNGRGISHDAREVRTKGAKTFATYFFPVGGDIERIFGTYVSDLRNNLGWGENDPLFSSTKQTVGDARMFESVGLSREHWRTTDPLRHICRRAFEGIGLPNYAPHSIRRSLVALGERLCRTPEEFKAWSQNLGHEDVMTTFRSYGAVSELRQSELLQKLPAQSSSESQSIDQLAELIAAKLRKE
jgi:integrase